MERAGGRKNDELRPVKITVDYLNRVPGSVLIEQGNTKVLVNATIEDTVPSFLKGSGTGWITAEYSMLPRSSDTRIPRERKHISGRTYEIQRLIGRSIRQAFDLKRMGEKTIIIDCDVLQADGGTRTASITGAFVSVYHAFKRLMVLGEIEGIPLKSFVAAVSVGIINNEFLLDLDYQEDSQADVDMNVVMTEDGNIIEIQGTGEGRAFTRDEMDKLVELAWKGIRELVQIQRNSLSTIIAG